MSKSELVMEGFKTAGLFISRTTGGVLKLGIGLFILDLAVDNISGTIKTLKEKKKEKPEYEHFSDYWRNAKDWHER